MEYKDMITNAIEKRELEKLLRGEGEYVIILPDFAPDVFPTDIDSILIGCFYNQSDRISGIDKIFNESLCKLINGDVSDVYTAVLYFDSCLFQEERNNASFLIDRTGISKKLKDSLKKHKEELQTSVRFRNGMEKKNPWRNIENFNKYYVKKYGFSII